VEWNLPACFLQREVSIASVTDPDCRSEGVMIDDLASPVGNVEEAILATGKKSADPLPDPQAIRTTVSCTSAALSLLLSGVDTTQQKPQIPSRGGVSQKSRAPRRTVQYELQSPLYKDLLTYVIVSSRNDEHLQTLPCLPCRDASQQQWVEDAEFQDPFLRSISSSRVH
jgi:hypothetical protein